MRHKQQRLLEQNIQNLESYIKEHELKISPEKMVLSITEADPDWQNFKNSKWLIKNLLNKNFLWEDIEAGKQSKAFDTLSRFLNIRKQWNDTNYENFNSKFLDINQYTGLSGIVEVIRPFEITKSMGELKREEKAKIYSETIVVYDKNDYLVVIPKTQEASCFWGRGTEWCTASTRSENYFDAYNIDSPLIIAITPDNRKYQFHINSEPMDENDKPIKNITDPVLVELASSTKKINSIKIDYDNLRYLQIAILENGNIIRFVNSDIPEYIELCKLAVKQNGLILHSISPDIPEYTEICKLAIQQNGNAIRCINHDMPEYIELCKLAVQQNGKTIRLIHSNTKEYSDFHDKDVMRELCKLAVQQDGESIQYIAPELFSKEEYFELCKVAVKNKGDALDYITSNTFEGDRYFELCKLAVQQNGEVIQNISPKIEKYLELCQLAVRQNGLAIYYILYNLMFAMPNMENNLKLYSNDKIKEIYSIAVQQNGNAIEYIPSKNFEQDSDNKDYFEICKLAVQQNGIAIRLILPENFKNRENYLELCNIAIQNDRDSLIYISSEYYKDLQKYIGEHTYIVEDINQEQENLIPEWLINKAYEPLIENFNQLEERITHQLTLKQSLELS